MVGSVQSPPASPAECLNIKERKPISGNRPESVNIAQLRKLREMVLGMLQELAE